MKKMLSVALIAVIALSTQAFGEDGDKKREGKGERPSKEEMMEKRKKMMEERMKNMSEEERAEFKKKMEERRKRFENMSEDN